MTPLSDRFLRGCRRESVDATPVWFMRQAGRSQPEYRALRERFTLLEIVRDPELCAQVTLRPVEQLGVDAAILFADIMLPVLAMGVSLELSEGGGPRIHHPLRTMADVAALRPFAPDNTVASLLKAIHIIRRACPVPLIGFAGGPFTVASYLIEGGPSREFLETKTLMYRDPSTWTALMERLTDATIGYVQMQVQSGVQALQLFDSWVGCLSPHDYQSYVAPYSSRVLDAVATSGVPSIHFGTNTAGLLEAMTAAGGDVLGLDWRVGLGDAWERIGPTRSIQGNLDPAAMLADTETMLARARDVLDQAAGRPGHIFNLGHGVLPQTSPDALKRLAAFVHEYRVREQAPA